MTPALSVLPSFRATEPFVPRVLCLLVLLGAVAFCYWPGLYGGFVFDDDVNILGNENLRLTSLNVNDLWAAAWSGHAGPLGRPVSLVSFALNYLAGGADPFLFKVVNLLIHLVNALLVAALAQILCEAIAQVRQESSHRQVSKWAGWVVAALWALHPLNLTGVLYVVQRMTSLCTLFGLAALLLYAAYRSATWSRHNLQRPLLKGALVGLLVLACLAMSALSKETGVLFLPLLLWVELCVFRFRVNGSAGRVLGLDLRQLMLWLVSLAAAYVILFKLPVMLAPAAFGSRDFNLIERGLTESRVLFFYLRLFLLPSNAALSLYHDDFSISHSLLDPPSTVLALAGLAMISVLTWLFRKRLPELGFAWGWFLIAHSLESTVFPLELVYEHRNYFATIGLLMLAPLALQRVETLKARRLFVVLLAGYLGLLGFVTHVRALQWSNHVDWAVLEASNHPQSTRATYELARVYMVLMQSTGEARYGELADQALKASTETHLPGVLPFVARIQLAYFRGLEPEAGLVSEVKEGFATWPYRAVNTATLNSLVSCQVDGRCKLPDAQAMEILDAAIQNPRQSDADRAEVLKLIAQYRINRFNDLVGGNELVRQAVELYDKPENRIMYAQSMALQQKYNEALEQLAMADALDHLGTLRRLVDRERAAIRAAQSK